MQKLVATLRYFFGVGKLLRASQTRRRTITNDLRSMVLNLTPAEIGLSPQTFPLPVWGVVMEHGINLGFYTLVVLADGTTSLYFSTGGAVIGAGEEPGVRDASRQFLGWANRMVGSAQQAASLQPPVDGETRFFFLTFDGIPRTAAPAVDWVKSVTACRRCSMPAIQ